MASAMVLERERDFGHDRLVVAVDGEAEFDIRAVEEWFACKWRPAAGCRDMQEPGNRVGLPQAAGFMIEPRQPRGEGMLDRTALAWWFAIAARMSAKQVRSRSSGRHTAHQYPARCRGERGEGNRPRPAPHSGRGQAVRTVVRPWVDRQKPDRPSGSLACQRPRTDGEQLPEAIGRIQQGQAVGGDGTDRARRSRGRVIRLPHEYVPLVVSRGTLLVDAAQRFQPPCRWRYRGLQQALRLPLPGDARLSRLRPRRG